jgi:predicted dehydrogenase
MSEVSNRERSLSVGMAGLGMIFHETYRPCFEQLRLHGLFRRDFGLVEVKLSAAATRTSTRPLPALAGDTAPVRFSGASAIESLLQEPIDIVCVATPDNRHFAVARAALAAGKHVLIEKPSVLHLHELDELTALAIKHSVLAKVVYHKLFDPDHKKLRTHVVDGALRHVNNGYCSLLEPKRISREQFAEWIAGRNPGTYVAVHYLKLIDFTFGPNWRLRRVHATGQRGLVADATGSTWDSVQLQVVFEYPDAREAAFDIHTSWVLPDDFPGVVEQEVQFRFDNGVWNAHQRKRGVELAVEGRTPSHLAITPNHHYSAATIEPWNERAERGYGIEAIRRFFEEVAYVEFGGAQSERHHRLEEMRDLAYNDLSADRNVVAAVQALEAILSKQAGSQPGCFVKARLESDGLWLHAPGHAEPERLYASAG